MSDQPHDALHPAQNVGMALSFTRKATDFLEAAAEQEAVVLPRAVVERAIRLADELHDDANEMGRGGAAARADKARIIVDTLSFYVDT